MSDESTLSGRLSVAMKRAGLTQGALCENSGVAQSNISRLLRGQSATIVTIIALADALGVADDWLAFGSRPPSPTSNTDALLQVQHEVCAHSWVDAVLVFPIAPSLFEHCAVSYCVKCHLTKR